MLKKKIINKIGIIINWTRELDYYESFIKEFDRNKIVLVLNDIPTKEIERKNNFSMIVENLKKKNVDYFLFTEIYNKYKFKIIISTGLTCANKITIISLLKFLYANSFGLFLKFIKVDILLSNIFRKDVSGGASKDKIYNEWFPERKIGVTTVFFPRGLDLRLKHFPNEKFKKIFDIFLCYGKFDKELIQKKFKNSKNFIIGYPKYDSKLNLISVKNKILNEFKIKENKKLIFWCPTYIEEEKEVSENIKIWLSKISKLRNDYNIIIRPHPKNIVVDENLQKKILNHGIFLDDKTDRNLLELYSVADLVLVDYGASVLTSIYLKKNVALLELPNNFEFIKRLEKTKSLDFEIRKEINQENILKIQNTSLINNINILINNLNNENVINLKKKYFGSIENNSLKKTINELQKKITND